MRLNARESLYESFQNILKESYDVDDYRINNDDDIIIIRKNGQVIDKGLVDDLKDNWNDFDDFKFDEKDKKYHWKEYTVEKIVTESNLNEIDTWVDPRSKQDGWKVKVLDVYPDEKGNAVAKVEVFNPEGESTGEETTFINRKKVKIGETYDAYIDGIMAMPRIKGVDNFDYDEIKGKGRELYEENITEAEGDKYIVFQRGGMLGDNHSLEDKIFDSKEEAQEALKAWKNSYGRNKSYYQPAGNVTKYKGKTPKQMKDEYRQVNESDALTESDNPFYSFQDSGQEDGLLGRLWFNIDNSDKYYTADLMKIDGEYRLVTSNILLDTDKALRNFIDTYGYDNLLDKAISYYKSEKGLNEGSPQKSNEFLARDWKKLQNDPQIGAKEHWSDAYFHEVEEYGKSQLKESSYYYKQWGNNGAGEIDYLEFNDEWEAQNYAEEVNKKTGNETAVYRMDNDECIALFDAHQSSGDFDNIVIDSYNHFTNDLGKTPSVDDIFDDIINSYSQDYISDETPEKSLQGAKDIKYVLSHNNLKYLDGGDKGLDESNSGKRLPNISKFIYDIDLEKGNAWSVQDYTKNGKGDKIIIVSRNGRSENSAEDIIKAVEEKYPQLNGEPTINGRAIWFKLKESSLKEATDNKEWEEICKAFCKKIGAELVFVNDDNFGYMDKDGAMVHMYADELEQYLKGQLNEAYGERMDSIYVAPNEYAMVKSEDSSHNVLELYYQDSKYFDCIIPKKWDRDKARALALKISKSEGPVNTDALIKEVENGSKKVNEAIEQKYEKSNDDYNSFLRDVKKYTGSYDYLYGGRVDSEYAGNSIKVQYFYYNRPYVGGGYNLVVNVITPMGMSGGWIQDEIEKGFERNSTDKLSNKEIKDKITQIVSQLD